MDTPIFEVSPELSLPPLFRLALNRGETGGVIIHLRRGAPINGRDSRGRTPLMIVAASGRPDLCQLLLSEGADPYLTDPDGRTAFDIAQKSAFPDVAKILSAELSAREIAQTADLASSLLDGIEWQPESMFEITSSASEPAVEVLDLQSFISAYRIKVRSDEWSIANIDLPDRKLAEIDLDFPRSLRSAIEGAMADGWVTSSQLKQSWAAASDDQLRLLKLLIKDAGVRLIRRGEVVDVLLNFTMPGPTQSSKDACAELLDSLNDLLRNAGEPAEARYLNDISRFSGYGAEFEARIFWKLSEARNKAFEELNKCPDLFSETFSAEGDEDSDEEGRQEQEDEEFDQFEDLKSRYEDGDGVLPYAVLLRRLKQIGPPNFTIEMQNLSLALDRYRVARDRAIEGGIKLVPWVAKRYRNRGLPFEDLIQEGNIGLIRAIEKYDLSNGARFSTYAVWWIRQSILRAIDDQLRIIRVPVHALEASRKVERLKLQIKASANRDATEEEVAETLELTQALVSRIFRLPVAITDHEFTEKLDENAISSDETYDQVRWKTILGQMLLGLPPRTERVIRLRFGLGASDENTLEEVGERFGVTRERIRQIEAHGLRRLRHKSRLKKLLAAYGY